MTEIDVEAAERLRKRLAELKAIVAQETCVRLPQNEGLDELHLLLQAIMVDHDMLNVCLTETVEKLEQYDKLVQRRILGLDVLNSAVGKTGSLALAAAAWASAFVLSWLLVFAIVGGWLPWLFLALFALVALANSSAR